MAERTDTAELIAWAKDASYFSPDDFWKLRALAGSLGASVERVAALEAGRLRDSTPTKITEEAVAAWFRTRASASVARVIKDGQSVIDERAADGVFE